MCPERCGLPRPPGRSPLRWSPAPHVAACRRARRSSPKCPGPPAAGPHIDPVSTLRVALLQHPVDRLQPQIDIDPIRQMADILVGKTWRYKSLEDSQVAAHENLAKERTKGALLSSIWTSQTCCQSGGRIVAMLKLQQDQGRYALCILTDTALQYNLTDTS